MTRLHLKIVTPEKEIFDEDVDQVNVPSSEGQLGILPNHVNLMAKVVPGELQIKRGLQTQLLASGSGFIEVVGNQVTLLTDMAEDAEDIDEEAVKEAKTRAEKTLEDVLSDEEYAETLASLEKSLARLKVKRRHRSP